MEPMLAAWSGLRVRGRLPGGARNTVLLAERGQELLVVRRSTRTPASLEWELDLLEHLERSGVGVPELVPTDDGRRHVDGVQVHRFVPGRAPEHPDEWRAVVEMVSAVHRSTVGWPQRPGFASSRQLLADDRGGDVRLDAMPTGAAAMVRAAWQPVHTVAESAIHGDLGAGNVLVDGDRVTLLDWDESRVDVPWFDFAFLPSGVEVPAVSGTTVELDALITAGVAWEAATCWQAEPGYAAGRLAELRRRRDVTGQR